MAKTPRVPKTKLIGVNWYTLDSVVIAPKADELRHELEANGWVVWLVPLEETMFDKVAVYKRKPMTKAKWNRKRSKMNRR